MTKNPNPEFNPNDTSRMEQTGIEMLSYESQAEEVNKTQSIENLLKHFENLHYSHVENIGFRDSAGEEVKYQSPELPQS